MTPADRNVRRWLIASAGAVALAVVVGGITRLTESGLSITEWKPVAGILPPLTPAAWDAVYQQYLRIPEAQTVHQGITLAEFKSLYWWEWVHRLLARGVGLVLAIPYFWFAVKRRLRPGHVRRLLMLPILTAAQGALGWYMVKSGLIGRTDVSAYRLAAHLALALLIFVLAVWTALELGRPPGSARLSRPWARSAVLGVAGIVATMLSGAFVAGLDGGKVYNTFPLMGGRLIPPGYQALGGGGWWRNAFENPIAAQFHHRVLAIGTAVLLLVLAGLIARTREPASLRRAGMVLALAIVAQVTVGIITLLAAVPVWLGVLHQLTALAVLTAGLITAYSAAVRTPAPPVSAEV